MTVRVDTLPNGFRVATERMPGLASAAIGVWVEAGARHERAEQNGIAHFLEHMAFKGTRPAQRAADRRADRGRRRPPQRLHQPRAHRLLRPRARGRRAARARHHRRYPAQLGAGRRARSRSSAASSCRRSARRTTRPTTSSSTGCRRPPIPDQPMGRAILGPPERIRAYGRDDLGGFIGAHYRPDRMILSAAGAVDHDAIMRLAETPVRRHGSGAASRPRSRPATPAASTASRRRSSRRISRWPSRRPAIATTTITPRRSPRWRSAAACPRGCSRRRARSAASATRSSRKGSAWSETGMMTIYAGTGAEEIGAARRPDRRRAGPRRPRLRRGRDRPRPRPDQGGAGDGPRKPLGAGRADGGAAVDLGQRRAAGGDHREDRGGRCRARPVRRWRGCCPAGRRSRSTGPVSRARPIDELAARLAA